MASKVFWTTLYTESCGPRHIPFVTPPAMKRAHDVFHVSKLKNYLKPQTIEGPLPIVIDADGTIEQEVAEILEKKWEKRRIYYLVRFADEPKTEAIWLSNAELKTCTELVKKYEKATRTSHA